MNVLCNLPLECFDDRTAFRQRLLTFGPKDRMWVDGRLWPFDLDFDPARGSIEDLLALLPRDFWPDVLLLWWPDQEPLPAGLERCPVTVVGVLSDYNLSLPYVAGLWPLLDVLLVDRPGVPLFESLSFPDVRPFCQFSFKAIDHRPYPDVVRDVDIAFAGNLNPVVQKERAPWIERLTALRRHGLRVEVTSGIFGERYGRFLASAKLGFNRSIRGEMNLRGFEVPACGGLLLMERDNREVRDFFTPGEEVVLYGDDDFEDVVLATLADESRRAAMAAAGHARVQEHRMSRRVDSMAALLEQPGPGRPPADAFACTFARGVAMLGTWAPPDAALACMVAAYRLRPDDARVENALALALLRERGSSHAAQAADLLARACQREPGYVPAALNLVTLLEAAGHHDSAVRRRRDLERRLGDVRTFADLDGPVLPLGYSERAIAVSGALRHSVLQQDPRARLAAWAG